MASGEIILRRTRVPWFRLVRGKEPTAWHQCMILPCSRGFRGASLLQLTDRPATCCLPADGRTRPVEPEAPRLLHGRRDERLVTVVRSSHGQRYLAGSRASASWALAVVAALVVVTAEASPQKPPVLLVSTVSGTVVEAESGRAIPGATVIVRTVDSRAAQGGPVRTDRSGRFAVRVQRFGPDLEIVASKAGDEDATTSLASPAILARASTRAGEERIDGIVLTLRPGNFRVVLIEGDAESAVDPPSVPVDASGAFLFPTVTAGTYRIRAIWSPRSETGASQSNRGWKVPARGLELSSVPPTVLWGETGIEVRQDNPAVAEIVLTAGSRFSGRVTVDDGSRADAVVGTPVTLLC